jgi:hypothetical protein
VLPCDQEIHNLPISRHSDPWTFITPPHPESGRLEPILRKRMRCPMTAKRLSATANRAALRKAIARGSNSPGRAVRTPPASRRGTEPPPRLDPIPYVDGHDIGNGRRGAVLHAPSRMRAYIGESTCRSSIQGPGVGHREARIKLPEQVIVRSALSAVGSRAKAAARSLSTRCPRSDGYYPAGGPAI